MTADEWIYLFLLVGSVPLGQLIKATNDYHHRKYICFGIGALIVVITCGFHGLHSLLTAFVNAAIVTFLKPNVSHLISMVWCFGYIVFVRTTHYVGLPPIDPLANAVQLLLTLKMVGVAFEVHDSYMNRLALSKNKDDKNLQLKNKYQNIDASFTDLMMYSYCYIGLFTGPYYKYRTYHDMLLQENNSNIDTLKHVAWRLFRIPFYSAGFLIVSMFFNIKDVQTDSFYEEPFWYRLLFIVPMFFIFRMRFYVAWMLAECMCVTAGLGAYPISSKPKTGQGPTDYLALEKREEQAPEGIAYCFDTVHNIDEYGCDLAPTVRDGLRSWNTTVQYWMASHVYRRVPVKSGAVRMALTMGLSAFWHGVHPGYYLSFLSVVPCIIAEDLLLPILRDGRSPTQQKVVDWICWFHKQRQFDYMNMAFLLLTLEKTFRFWKSIYFIGHVTAILLIILGVLLSFFFKKPKKSSKKIS